MFAIDQSSGSLFKTAHGYQEQTARRKGIGNSFQNGEPIAYQNAKAIRQRVKPVRNKIGVTGSGNSERSIGAADQHSRNGKEDSYVTNCGH